MCICVCHVYTYVYVHIYGLTSMLMLVTMHSTHSGVVREGGVGVCIQLVWHIALCTCATIG